MRSIKLDKLDRSSILFICRAELSAFGSLYGEKDKYGLGDDLNMCLPCLPTFWIFKLSPNLGHLPRLLLNCSIFCKICHISGWRQRLVPNRLSVILCVLVHELASWNSLIRRNCNVSEFRQAQWRQLGGLQGRWWVGLAKFLRLLLIICTVADLCRQIFIGSAELFLNCRLGNRVIGWRAGPEHIAGECGIHVQSWLDWELLTLHSSLAASLCGHLIWKETLAPLNKTRWYFRAHTKPVKVRAGWQGCLLFLL